MLVRSHPWVRLPSYGSRYNFECFGRRELYVFDRIVEVIPCDGSPSQQRRNGVTWSQDRLAKSPVSQAR